LEVQADGGLRGVGRRPAGRGAPDEQAAGENEPVSHGSVSSLWDFTTVSCAPGALGSPAAMTVIWVARLTTTGRGGSSTWITSRSRGLAATRSGSGDATPRSCAAGDARL